jgi:hypothetical protein
VEEKHALIGPWLPLLATAGGALRMRRDDSAGACLSCALAGPWGLEVGGVIYFLGTSERASC